MNNWSIFCSISPFYEPDAAEYENQARSQQQKNLNPNASTVKAAYALIQPYGTLIKPFHNHKR
jgi:hypothetical protein